jgi:hypothetical protein
MGGLGKSGGGELSGSVVRVAAAAALLLLVPVAGAGEPVIEITAHPPAVSTSTSATFEFRASQNGSFRCTLDGRTQACTSPRTYTGLDLGVHQFAVRLTRSNASAARWTWTVIPLETPDPPTTTIVSGPSGEVTSTSATFTFTASEAGATFACELDGGSDVACSSPTTYVGLSPGPHRFRVRATGAGGQGPRAEREWTIEAGDTTAPALTLPAGQTLEADGPGGARATFTVSATDAGAPLPASAISCSPPSGSTFRLGATTVACTARDEAGNEGKGGFTVTVRDTTPPTINAPDVSVTATSAAGIRRTDADLARYLSGVTAADLVSKPTITNTAPERLPVGRTEVTFTARDEAGNSASRRATVTVLPVGRQAPPLDLRPPGNVRRAAARAGDHLVRLSWVVPRRDFHHVTVTRSLVGKKARAKVVYRGRRKSFVDRRLRNNQLYRYVIVAFDRAGNRSRGIVVTARPRAILLARPKTGQRVARPPLLVWAPMRNASYFNLQLWRGKQKLLSTWPDRARFQLRRSWTYGGRPRRLTPGVYTWYVWPGIGARSAARYGPMMGRSTFIVVSPV